MFKKIYSNSLLILIFTIFSLQIAYAVNDPSSDSNDNQPSFPFDNACLKFDKANFKVGGELLDMMKTGDFPQYCVLYPLSNYHIKQKRDDGYFIIGPNSTPQAQETMVFLKSNMTYQENKTLVSNNSDPSKPTGQWAYFIGPVRFSMENGEDKEYYTFQEIDF